MQKTLTPQEIAFGLNRIIESMVERELPTIGSIVSTDTPDGLTIQFDLPISYNLDWVAGRIELIRMLLQGDFDITINSMSIGQKKYAHSPEYHYVLTFASIEQD